MPISPTVLKTLSYPINRHGSLWERTEGIISTYSCSKCIVVGYTLDCSARSFLPEDLDPHLVPEFQVWKLAQVQKLTKQSWLCIGATALSVLFIQAWLLLILQIEQCLCSQGYHTIWTTSTVPTGSSPLGCYSDLARYYDCCIHLAPGSWAKPPGLYYFSFPIAPLLLMSLTLLLSLLPSTWACMWPAHGLLSHAGALSPAHFLWPWWTVCPPSPLVQHSPVALLAPYPLLGSILSLLSHCLSWKFRHFYSKLISTNLFSMLLGSNLLGVFISSFRVLARGLNPISQENSPVFINYLLSPFVFYPFPLGSANSLLIPPVPAPAGTFCDRGSSLIRVLSLLYLMSIAHSQLGYHGDLTLVIGLLSRRFKVRGWGTNPERGRAHVVL